MNVRLIDSDWSVPIDSINVGGGKVSSSNVLEVIFDSGTLGAVMPKNDKYAFCARFGLPDCQHVNHTTGWVAGMQSSGFFGCF